MTDLKARVAELNELFGDLLSVENHDTIGGMWEATSFERSDNGDPIYRADIDKSQLIDFRKRAKALENDVSLVMELLQMTGEALTKVMVYQTEADGEHYSPYCHAEAKEAVLKLRNAGVIV